MSSTQIVSEELKDRNWPAAGPILPMPESFSEKPVAVVPYPPLVSGGWYQGADDEVAGPGWYRVPRPADRSARTALFWTAVLGPLGLCYLSAVRGLIATAVSAAVVIVAGSVLPLAVIWPVVMVYSFLIVRRR
jgi:hypothetical protein